MIRIFGMIFATIVAAGPVAAQPFFDPQYSPYPFRGVYPNPYYPGPAPGRRRAFGEPTGVCQKLCVQDTSPCDPPEFKQADGRCNDPARRL